jgi:hypothetical protein
MPEWLWRRAPVVLRDDDGVHQWCCTTVIERCWIGKSVRQRRSLSDRISDGASGRSGWIG